MDKNIVSFIESIEPDFSYQGTEGAMALIVESNDNMLVIESYLDSVENEAIQEAEDTKDESKVKAAYGWAKDKAKKAYDYIIKAIKVAIAKIKGIFFTMVKKAKMLYAQAAKKIADMLTRVSTSDKPVGGDLEVKYKDVVSSELDDYIRKFKPENTKYFKYLESDSMAAGDSKSGDAAPSADDILKACLGDTTLEKVKSDCLVERTASKVSPNETLKLLKNFFDSVVMGYLNDLYETIMNNKKSMLATISKLRTAEGSNRHNISYANKVVNSINAASTMFFNTVFGIVIGGLHSRIRMCVSLIRARISKGASDLKTKATNVKNAAIKAKDDVKNAFNNESVEDLIK